MKHNQLVQTFQEWGPEFHVEFDIVVYKLPTDVNWLNVIRIGNGGNNEKYGDRIATFFLGRENGKFWVSNVLNGQGDHFDNVVSTLNKKSHVVIKQYQKGPAGAQNIWTYTKIDDKVLRDQKNDQPGTFQNVMVFAGDPWYPAFTSEFGKVENMIVYQGMYFH